MSIADILYQLLLKPAELFCDAVCTALTRLTTSPGWSIIGLSLVVNLLLLPLYKKRDMLGENSSVKGTSKAGLAREAARLALQILFFVAVYRHFNQQLSIGEIHFGLVPALGQPDGLIRIGGTGINVLPVAAAALYLAAGMLRTKKLSLPHRLCCAAVIIGAAVFLYDKPASLNYFWAAGGIFALIRELTGTGGRFIELNKRQQKTDRSNKILLVLCCVYLTLMTGLLIPSEILKTSPAEFMHAHSLQSPERYLKPTALIACGTFAIWGIGYGLLMSAKARKRYAVFIASLSIASVINYLFFSNYGTLYSSLRYEKDVYNPILQMILNTAIIIVVVVLVIVLRKRLPIVLRVIAIYGCVAMTVMSVINIRSLRSKVAEVRKVIHVEEETATFGMDRQGQNVVVIMLDRAISGFIPYYMNEKPELVEQFDGFTFYPNTLSYGYHTNIAAPALFGGYEYVPDELDKREDELLMDKHNEALKVMPVLFRDNGFEVTVCDAPYGNYQWISDLSIYDEYPEIRKFNTIGMFDDNKEKTQEELDYIRERNLFCYSLFRISPQVLNATIYDHGKYLEMNVGAFSEEGDNLIGVSADFLSSYNVLKNLNEMTQVTENGSNHFLMLTNEITHNPTELKEPEYIPARDVDNTEYEEEHSIRSDGRNGELKLSEQEDFTIEHYHVGMAAMIQLGNWFDELRKAGVYDNTRIIIVSDHGCYLGLFGFDLRETDPGMKGFSKHNMDEWTDTMCYNPLLMVKDFGAEGFSTDNTFMTNADTPSIALSGIAEAPVNPFTGKQITTEAKNSGEQHILESDWHIEWNNGNTFADPVHITFRGNDIFNPENWSVER